MSTTAQAPAEKINKPALLICVVVMTLMVCLDTSIVNVALPVMADELAVTMAEIEWVVSTYLLVCCSGLLICGRLGDIFGKVRVFQAGVGVFAIGSLLCGFAPNLPVVIVGRAVQGVGAAAAFSNNHSIITENFGPHERGGALGVLSTAAAIGSLVGPSLGGLLVTLGDWSLIFLINVPIGIVAFLAGLKFLPNRHPEEPSPLDVPGSIMLFVSLMLVIAAITLMQQNVSMRELAMLIGGVALLIVFFAYERRVEYPVFPVSALKNPALVLNLMTLFVIFFIISGQELILPFYFQDARQMTPLHCAIFLSIIPVIIGIGGPLAGRWSDRIGCYIPTTLGLGLVLVAMLVLSSLGIETHPAVAAAGLVIYGFGESLFIPPNNSLIMGSARPEELGFIGGLSGFSRMFGMAAGVTAATTALYGHMSAQVGRRVIDFIDDQPEVFTQAMSFVFLMFAVVVLAGFVATIYRFVKFRREQTENKS